MHPTGSSRTGTNATPLGQRRLPGNKEESSPITKTTSGPELRIKAEEDLTNQGVPPQGLLMGGMDSGIKRGRSSKREEPEIRKRKKANRWGTADENKVAGLMGLPTIILTPMTSEQLDAYTIHLRVEEITQKLKIGDIIPADGHRSLSPAPTYDSQGRRINTREYRYRKRLEEERHKLIQKANTVFTNYHAPSDYRRPTKTIEKIYVPVNDYPEINFIGLLIGPRGNTLKRMESESGAKIAIRGRGSVKEGKGASDRATDSNLDEDLHCLIIADTETKIEMAKKAILEVIETAASIPEGQNTLKRNQLRELASLNGTLRDDENQACQNCGGLGHRKYECPEKRNITSNVICRVCGNSGHMARDCRDRQKGSDWRNNDLLQPQTDAVDREYDQLMLELAGDGSHQGVAGSLTQHGLIESGPEGDSYQGNRSDDKRPWERGPTGGPAPWRTPGSNSGIRPMRTENHDAHRNDLRDVPKPPPTGPSKDRGLGAPPWQQQQQYRPVKDARLKSHDDPPQFVGPSMQSYPSNSMGPPPWQGGQGDRQNRQTQGYSTHQEHQHRQSQHQQLQNQQMNKQSYGNNAHNYVSNNPYLQTHQMEIQMNMSLDQNHLQQSYYSTGPTANYEYGNNDFHDQALPPPPPPPERCSPPPPPPPSSPPPPPPPLPPPRVHSR